MTPEEMEQLAICIAERVVGLRLPTVLTKAATMRELSVGRTKFGEMVRSGAILTCDVGGTEMIPRSEVLRLATPLKKVAAKPVRRPRLVAAFDAKAEAEALRKLR